MFRLGRFIAAKKEEYAFYDLDYNRLPQLFTVRQMRHAPEKSKNWEELIGLTRILCRDFLFVRVDFYEIKDKIYFSELTFTPNSGRVEWSKPKYDLQYGEMLKLPID